jgi:hypothetical protein
MSQFSGRAILKAAGLGNLTIMNKAAGGTNYKMS